MMGASDPRFEEEIYQDNSDTKKTSEEKGHHANGERYHGESEDPGAGIREPPGGWRDGANAESETGPSIVPDLGEWDAGEDTELPPPRGWLLGNQFARRFLSSVVAPGGVGKTSYRIVQFLSLTTRRGLTGQYVFQRCRVLMLSLEDDKDELRRRLTAARLYYKISPEDYKGWLYLAAPRGFKLAEMKDGSPARGMLEKMLRDAIVRLKLDLISLDPFVKTHALEENSSGAMDFVCDLLARLSIEFDISVDAPHHARKGQFTPGDADAGRGSSGIKDAGRLVYTLSPMTPEEADKLGVPPEECRFYVRLDSAKVNISPPSDKATWFKLVNQPIGNGNDMYPNGDDVQVIVPWKPPALFEDLDARILNKALDEIEKGLPNGQRYSSANAAKERAAWKVVNEHCPSKTEKQCQAIINTWVKTKLLYSAEYVDPVQRRSHVGLHVDNAKRPGSCIS